MALAPKEKRLKVVVITNDEALLERAHRQLAGCRLIHRRTDSVPKNLRFDYAIIDTRTLEPEGRRRIYNLGSSHQRIALCDPKLDNLLAKTHAPLSSDLRSPIMTCLEMALAKAAPRGLREKLSGLPYG